MQLDMQLIAGRLGNMEWIHKDAPRGCTHVEASGILFLSHQEPSAEAEHIPPVKETEFLVPRNQELLSHCMASVIRYKKVGSPASVILKFSLELKCGANGGGNQKEVARENNQRTQSIFLSPGNPLKAVTVSQKIKPNSKVVYFLAARTLWSPIHEDCKRERKGFGLKEELIIHETGEVYKLIPERKFFCCDASFNFIFVFWPCNRNMSPWVSLK
ncbi:uncharacterized protein [Manis javanica]|uniref:uncharacterized protein isoform X3 n=1 Tax=Manis javanica TaxID=9974 RepID=UPI003C6D1608